MPGGGKSLTIIAGGGSIPGHVARAANRGGRSVLIIGIDGEADPTIAEFPHVWLKWGEIGRLESLLADHGAEDVVLVGGIRSLPDFTHVKLDLGAVRVLPEVIKLVASGDSDLLNGVVRMLEKRHYNVVGAHEIAPDLVVEEGVIGARHPGKGAERDARLAMSAARAIGQIDAGQAAVAVNGRIVALEAAEGTDGILERVGSLRRDGRLSWRGRAGVLAKCAKPQQDLRVDMPAIGPRTIDTAAAAGLAGIAVEAGRVMVVERDVAVDQANAAGLFLVGLPAGKA